MNIERFKAIIDKIEANPACWKQDSWHCGTSHCLAGHAQIDSGKAPNDATVRRDARIWLDLPLAKANYLFAARRTLEDFKSVLEMDRDGFNRDGFNRDGFNRAGYDCDGYDRSGFNRDGYDCDGLDTNNQMRPDAA